MKHLDCKLLVTLFLLGLHIVAFSQQYGNEWIVPGQQYYKIETYQNGFYAITGRELIENGVAVQQLNPANIQLWHRGKEQAILLKGSEDGRFDPEDSLIFYGKRNDGTLDAYLYNPAESQPHSFINLHSDTCAFFLTEGRNPGKRIQKKPYQNAVTSIDWHWQEELIVLAEAYNRGVMTGENRSAYFTYGEGWTGAAFGKGPSNPAVDRVYNLPVSAIRNSGPDSRLEVLLSGYNKEKHNVEIIVGTNNSVIGSLPVQLFEGFENRKFFTYIPSGLMTGTSLRVTVRLKGSSSYTDRIGVSYIKLEYPQEIIVPAVSDRRLNFDLATSASVTVPESFSAIYNVTDLNSIYEAEPSAGSQILLPAGKQQMFVSSAGTPYLKPHKIVSALTSIHGADDSRVKNADFLIITHPRFRSEAEEYARYRNSVEGGSYQTSLSLAGDLFDEFAYGEFTPLAIRNYCRYMAEYSRVRYLFIIGRGVDLDYNHYRVGKLHRFNPGAYLAQNTWDYVENFVPHAGNPTSDLVYVNGLKGNPEHVAAFPVGRLNAKYPDEVRAYLNKVKTHESLPSGEAWRKNVLHLSGGKTTDEILNFKNKIESLAPIVEDTVFGGKVVKHIVKTVNYYVEDRLIETVAEQVNKGVSYITFLGHDSPNVKDIDIGYVTNQLYGYNNYGKYPMLILNGCNTVSSSVPYSLAENWLHTDNLGGILSMGHTDYGYISLLDDYTRVFYTQMFSRRATYETPLSVGDVQRLVHLEMNSYADFHINAMQQQVFLMGDPSIRMYAPEKPDFAIKNVVLASFDENPITAVSDSFKVHIDIQNFGLTYSEPVLITVQRTIGTITYLDTVSVRLPNYSGRIELTIRNAGGQGLHGVNEFSVTIDPYEQIAELDRQNNQYIFQYFMPASGIIAMFPEKYSIVNKPEVSLVAQSTDLYMEEKEFVFELDSSHVFDSPFKKTIYVKSAALVHTEPVYLLPDVALNDTMVYYWRVRFKEVVSELDTAWTYSSFVYIKNGPDGWSQSALPQIDEGTLQGLAIDINADAYVFSTLEAVLTAASPGKHYVGPDHTQLPIYYTDLGINGDGIVYENRGNCREGILAITMDKSDLVPYFPLTLNNVCGQSNSGKRINSFTNLGNTNDVSSGQFDLIRYLDAVKPGDYVLLMSSGTVPYGNWLPELKSKIEEVLGATLLNELVPDMPYIILGRKGHGTPLFEQYGEKDEIITYSHVLEGRNLFGTIESPVIGPASEWGSLSYQLKSQPGDHYRIALIGINNEGKKDTLYREVSESFMDLSDLDAVQFPYLQLKAYLYDSTGLTPPYLRYWNIAYEGVPEGTMLPLIYGKEYYDAVVKQEGDSVRWTYTFKNISPRPFDDALKVVFITRNMQSGRIKRDTIAIQPLLPGASAEFSYKFSTVGWAGENTLLAYVNPELQPELYYSNNVLEAAFSVIADHVNPLLDVTFDGVYLMDGEIISPSPMIEITLRDENRFRIMDDTSGLEIFLKRPCTGCAYERISYADPAVVSWGQISGQANAFKVEYNPQNLEDGIYMLRVQGKDASGNRSGLNPYEISFEVINESSVSNFYPYPNPFSSNVCFAFTLTGSRVPEEISVTIMNVTGQVVRKISKAAGSGSIRIGNNVSGLVWDGRDERGGQLANGIYLYKVEITGSEGFNHRETGADKVFRKNVGKIYLNR